jgi:hypothetical protein
MARAELFDERMEEDNEDVSNLDTQDTTEGLENVEQSAPAPEDDLPEKYRNKSAKEIAQMHQEAEKLLGRQSSEVGELRRVFDTYIQTQLVDKSPKKEEEVDDDLDFFSAPEKATARAIDNHPKVRQAEEFANQYRQQTAVSKLQSKHPDMDSILQNESFQNWVAASKIRTQLFTQAHQQYDYDAADEIFSLWKDRQQVVTQTAQAEKAGRKAAVNAANTGSGRGTGEGSRKVYRRSDIIKLMENDPERYEALSDEIFLAYKEGRVK